MPLIFPRRITRKVARTVIDKWTAAAPKDLEVTGPVDEADIIDYDDTSEEEAFRYYRLVDEIIEGTWAEARDAMTDAFLKTARRVVRRERAAEARRR